MGEEKEYFNFFSKIDLNYIATNKPIENSVIVANEHSFRGVVTFPNNAASLVKEINKVNKSLVSIAILDFPFGNSTLDSRIYSVKSLKEKGIKEIEIVAPNIEIENDLESMIKLKDELKIEIKYILPTGGDNIGVCKKMKKNVLDIVLFSNPLLSVEDNVLEVRKLKNCVSNKVKYYLNDETGVGDFTYYLRAGVDSFGLGQKKALRLIYDYQSNSG